MRLSSVLLVATAGTLIVTSNALSASTTSNQVVGVSAMASPDLVRSLEVTSDGKRSLRSHDTMGDDDEVKEEEEDGDGVGEEDDDEERANLFKTSKLDQMLRSLGTFKRFGKWKYKEYTPSEVRNKLEVIGGNKYKDLWEMYNANYYSIREVATK
ncbi:unnamed protein product [Phytophthora lilii]|uniref:RxLR effector protein n=1 Tax=Phytophthora lilii TaxID=2077276 RepID=A0A9W6TV84_9STRA|nr:unnamed protein product [Phytophthora lilii]